MPKPSCLLVSSAAEIHILAQEVLGTEGSVEITRMPEGPMLVESEAPATSVGESFASEGTVQFAGLETFSPPRGGPEMVYGRFRHPYEGDRSFADIYSFFADTCKWSEFIEPGSFVIDIGAHSGDTTLVMAALTGVGGTVLSFDPNPAVLPTLLGNAMINGAYDIEVEDKAVSTLSGRVIFTDHSNLMCNGGLISGLQDVGTDVVERIESLKPQRIEVDAVNLPEFLQRPGSRFRDRRVAFIKTDCEGFDALIVRSLKPLLARDNPVLFVEWFEWFSDAETEVLFSAIREVGYIPHEPQTLTVAVEHRRVSDLVCFPNSL